MLLLSNNPSFQLGSYFISAVEGRLLGALDSPTGAFSDALQQVVSFQAGFGGDGDMTLLLAGMKVRSYSDWIYGEGCLTSKSGRSRFVNQECGCPLEGVSKTEYR
jgi:hypothetical protein